MYAISNNITVRAQNEKNFAKNARAYVKDISSIVDSHTYRRHESALAIASDKKYQNKVARLAKKFKGVKHVILVGIGGSSLGTEAIYDALKDDKSPTLTIVDSLDDDALLKAYEIIKNVTTANQVAVIVISKSGTTTETVLNAGNIFERLEKRFGSKYTKSVVGVTSEKSPLALALKKKKIQTLSFPVPIGGRYSVFSAVGVLPLTLLKIDTKALLQGATDAVSKDNIDTHMELSLQLALQATSGIRTVNFFAFNKRHRTIGYWYRQLLAESIGKSKNIHNKPFSYGLLPTVSTSADLHSVAQLYLSKYKGVHTRFLSLEESSSKQTNTGWLTSDILPELSGQKRAHTQSALVEGVLRAYDDQTLPYTHTILAENSAYDIGFFMSSLMAEVMMLCTVLQVDAFNQPHVELYKNHMREASQS